MPARAWDRAYSIYGYPKELVNGSLVEVLPDWNMPAYTLHALTSKREQYPMKVHRCIDALKQYFSQLPGGRSLQGVA